VLCDAGRGDWLLCQITSNPHSDPTAVKITPADLARGTLSALSFARPTKLFTANETLMAKRVAILEDAPFGAILSTIISALQEVMPVQSDTADEVDQAASV
jgi:mRNA interferase MazF